MGRESIEQGHGRPAFRAFEEANPKLSEEAAWQLARFYDPTVMEPIYRSVASPNVGRALRYYGMGKSLASARHEEKLRSLCGAYRDVVTRDPQLQSLCNK